MLGNLIEGVKDIGIMAGPFLIGCPIMLAMEERKARKEMKARNQKRFEEIKANNRKRGINSNGR